MTFNEISFSDNDVVNPGDFIPLGDYNPHNVRPFLLHDHGFCLCVVFASCLQDALDIAADADKLDRFAVDADEQDREDLAYLGNASEPFDIESLDWIELPNPRFSFVALFGAGRCSCGKPKSSNEALCEQCNNLCYYTVTPSHPAYLPWKNNTLDEAMNSAYAFIDGIPNMGVSIYRENSVIAVLVSDAFGTPIRGIMLDGLTRQLDLSKFPPSRAFQFNCDALESALAYGSADELRYEASKWGLVPAASEDACELCKHGMNPGHMHSECTTLVPDTSSKY